MIVILRTIIVEYAWVPYVTRLLYGCCKIRLVIVFDFKLSLHYCRTRLGIVDFHE